MLDEIVEAIVPGTFYVGIGVAVGTLFGDRLRPVAKEAIKRGMTLSERLQEVSAEALERAQDLMAEARHEQQQEVARSRARSNGRPAARRGSRARPVRVADS